MINENDIILEIINRVNGGVQTLENMICKGWDETIIDVEKGSLWLLLLKHTLQREFCDIEYGKENIDIICWRIGDVDDLI